MSVPPAVGFYCDSPTARGKETGKEKNGMRTEYYCCKSTSSSKQKLEWGRSPARQDMLWERMARQHLQ